MTFKTYEDAVRYIESLERFKSEPGLERIRMILELFGNPHKDFKYIHIAGTNGKGSVSAFLTSLLRAAGYNVGTYNSPYLVRFTDRIMYNGEDIPKEALLELTNELCKTLDEHNKASREVLSPSFFEFTTALMFLYFAKKKPDYVILEVGLGGRWDATNVIDAPKVAVITTISDDHMHILGDTHIAIAKEKAEIIKPGTVCVTGLIESADAREHIEDVCKKRGVECKSANGYTYSLKHSGLDKQTFDSKYNNREFKDLKINIPGKYQIHNASIALAAFLEVLPDVSEVIIRNGLKETFWPGRFHIVSKEPLTVLDGAHNPDGASKLAEALKELNIENPVLLVGIAPKKDITQMAKEFLKISNTFIFTRARSRGMDKATVKAAFTELNPSINFDLAEMPEALECAKKTAKENNKCLVVAGSLYLIGEVLTNLTKS